MKNVILLFLATTLIFITACSSVGDNENSDSSSVSDNEQSLAEESVLIPDKSDVSAENTESSPESFTSSEALDNSAETEESASDIVQSDDLSESEEVSFSDSENDAESTTSEVMSAPPETEIESEIPDSNPESDTSDTLSTVEPDGAVFVSNGILIAGTRGMEQYYGSEASGAQYSAYVSAFKEDLGTDINVYSVVVPHASCYYAPAEYSNLITRGQVNFDNLKANAGSTVKYVDVYSALAKHTDEDIYPRTEHHWNALGAYYAAEEFAKVAGVDFTPLSNFEKIVKEGFVGTLYAFSKSSVLLNNPEDFVIYKPTQEYTADFCYEGNYNFDSPNYSRNSVVYDVKSYAGAFLGGDSVWVKITTDNNSGRKLVIFKDSYGNAFVPFTVGSFDEIYVLDLRNYARNGVEFCQSVGATDVAFVVSGFTATGSVYKNIEKIRTAP